MKEAEFMRIGVAEQKRGDAYIRKGKTPGKDMYLVFPEQSNKPSVIFFLPSHSSFQSHGWREFAASSTDHQGIFRAVE